MLVLTFTRNFMDYLPKLWHKSHQIGAVAVDLDGWSDKYVQIFSTEDLFSVDDVPQFVLLSRKIRATTPSAVDIKCWYYVGHYILAGKLALVGRCLFCKWKWTAVLLLGNWLICCWSDYWTPNPAMTNCFVRLFFQRSFLYDPVHTR